MPQILVSVPKQPQKQPSSLLKVWPVILPVQVASSASCDRNLDGNPLFWHRELIPTDAGCPKPFQRSVRRGFEIFVSANPRASVRASAKRRWKDLKLCDWAKLLSIVLFFSCHATWPSAGAFLLFLCCCLFPQAPEYKIQF